MTTITTILEFQAAQENIGLGDGFQESLDKTEFLELADAPDEFQLNKRQTGELIETKHALSDSSEQMRTVSR